MNYPQPMELHDYSYLGSDFRERERIKRKRQRWEKRLRSMPVLESHAIMAALETVRAEHERSGLATSGNAAGASEDQSVEFG